MSLSLDIATITPIQVQNLFERVKIHNDFYIDKDQIVPLPWWISLFSSLKPQRLKTAQFMLDLARQSHTIPGFSPDDTSKLVTAAAGYIRNNHLKDENLQLLSLQLGGAIPPDVLQSNPDYVSFIKTNKLHTHHSAMKITLPLIEGQPSLWINEKFVSFKDFKIVQEEPDTSSFFICNNKDPEELAFTTNEKGELKDYYFTPHKGIVRGLPMRHSEDILPFTMHSATGQYEVIYVTAITDPHSFNPTIVGDHSYIALQNPEGKRYSWGQFGYFGSLSLSNVFSKQLGGNEIPDRYIYMSDLYDIKETSVPVSEEHYQSLLNECIEDRKHPYMISALKENCTGYVKKKLKKIGIHVDSKMHLVSFAIAKLASLILPNSWKKAIHEELISFSLCQRNWSTTVKNIHKALHFLPCIYFPSLLIGLLIRTLSSCNTTHDISWSDIVFRPWKLRINHPLVLRRHQEGNARLTNLT